MFRIRCLAVTSLVLMAFVAGCPGPVADLPDLATVSGTVTMGGEPLANVTVEFASANGQAAYGTTDASGQYKLVYSGDAGGSGDWREHGSHYDEPGCPRTGRLQRPNPR